MQEFISLLRAHGELKIIAEPLDVYLEIPHLAYLEVKKPRGGKALLFTRPIHKIEGRVVKEFDIPVLMNIFGSYSRLELIVGTCIESIPKEIERLLHFEPPKNIRDFFLQAQKFFSLRYVLPKLTKSFAPCAAIVHKNEEVNLLDLPILKTWDKDGGPFITMGQVYTQNLDGKKKNLGMYRLQVYDRNHLGLHWQIHKDSNHFFHEYLNAGKKMPVSIAIGGDPLYTWCGQAPLPYGVYELMLYGFIKKKRPRLVSCLSNPLSVPADVDIVIEGWVDPKEMRLEGPFGDHTGFYTPVESYPVLEVSVITHKKSPVYLATVVGKPPLEDKYMGYLTERVFLPLLQTTAHGLIDYYMPENGVFHNLILARISPQYPGHSKQIMHNFWGTGQMSFVKHAIFVDEFAPNFTGVVEFEAIVEHILDHFSTQNLLISEGICDALDHSSPQYAQGGKLGVEAMNKSDRRDFELLDDDRLLALICSLMPEAVILKQYFTRTKNPICIVGVRKKEQSIIKKTLDLYTLEKYFAIVCFVDADKNDLNNLYMLLWRITNNIDAKRDIYIYKNNIFIDATDKNICDDYYKQWPEETDCTLCAIESLRKKGLLDEIDEGFIKKFQICSSPQT